MCKYVHVSCVRMNLCVHLMPCTRTPTVLSVRQLHEWADSTFSQTLFMCCVDPAPPSTARHFNIKAKWAGPPLSRRNMLFWFPSISSPLLHAPSLHRVFPLTAARASRVTWRRAGACRGLVSPPGPAVQEGFWGVVSAFTCWIINKRFSDYCDEPLMTSVTVHVTPNQLIRHTTPSQCERKPELLSNNPLYKAL